MRKQLVFVFLTVLVAACIIEFSSGAESDRTTKNLRFKRVNTHSNMVLDVVSFVLDEMEAKFARGRGKCTDMRVNLRQVIDAQRARVDGGTLYQIDLSTRLVSRRCRYGYSRSPCEATVFVPNDKKEPFQLRGLDCAVQ